MFVRSMNTRLDQWATSLKQMNSISQCGLYNDGWCKQRTTPILLSSLHWATPTKAIYQGYISLSLSLFLYSGTQGRHTLGYSLFALLFSLRVEQIFFSVRSCCFTCSLSPPVFFPLPVRSHFSHYSNVVGGGERESSKCECWTTEHTQTHAHTSREEQDEEDATASASLHWWTTTPTDGQ